MAIQSEITLHERTYTLPKRPTIVICIDGFDPEYLEKGVADGILPTFANMVEIGFHVTADCAMPSVTNVNNVSIITGVPPSVHGIAGNYFLDRATGKETMVLDDELLRGSTILAEMAKQGIKIAAITAKDKLRKILRHDLDDDKSICFSAQYADEEILKWLGRDSRPSQYSDDLSLFVLDAGLKILQENRADLFYLTLSDYVQHKNAPGTPDANEFMAAIDSRVRMMLDLGAVVALTGDHGMSDKSNENGLPNVLFVQDELEKKFGRKCARVICPITDPFVKHHGALGSFVRVHVSEQYEEYIPDMVDHIASFPEVDVTMLKEEAALQLELPEDREGDFVVISKSNAVLGSKAEEHDLSTLDGHRLRSHGGFSEQKIPLIMSVPAEVDDKARSKRWRNFDAFHLVLNYGQKGYNPF